MDMQKFETKTDDLAIWMKENDTGALAPLLSMQIEHGRTLSEESEIAKIWEAIRALCATLPNNPIKRGTPSKLPTEVSVLIETLSTQYGQTQTGSWAEGDMRFLICRLGKKSNGLFSEDNYHATMVRKCAQSLTKRYSLGIWDGTREGLENQDFSVLEDDSEE